MRIWKVLWAIAILMVVIVIAVSILIVENMDNNVDAFSDEPAITYKIGKEVKMDISGMHFGSLTILAVIRSVVSVDI